MAINFPTSPTTNDIHSENNLSWKFNGASWIALPTPSVAGNVAYTPAGTGVVSTTVESKLRESVSVKDFGAVGDGVTDDTVAIQNALDSGLNIFFPLGSYLTSSTLTITTAGQKLFGDTLPNALQSTKITTTYDGVCLLVTETQVGINNLSFKGVRQSNDVGIRFARTSNTDDTDGYVTNCHFLQWTTAVEYVSRGLRADNNLFTSCTLCIELSWATSGTIGVDEQALPYGFRATRITNNRGHSCATLVESTGANNEYLRGVVLTDNTMDIGEVLFKGGIMHSTIANNVIELANSTPIYINAGGEGMTISGNIITGTVGDASNSPAVGIWYGAGSNANDVIIANNVIRFVDGSAIRFDVNTNRVTIVGNSIKGVGQTGTGSCVDFNADVYYSSIVGNTLWAENTTNIITLAGVVANTTISGNGIDGADTLITGTFTDDGTNFCQSEGGISIGELGNPTNSINLKTSTSLPLKITRTGSNGGLVSRYSNDLGYVDFTFAPSGTGQGSVTANSDNTVDLGAGGARFKSLYLGTTTVSGLPSASASNAGARSMVTNANATTFYSVVAGSGSNTVPVFSDGVNWRIG